MIEKPKKERRFLKTLGRVGEILVEQVLLKLGSSIIKKIGGKKTLPSILFLLASFSLFAQYPNTGNKQRLGFQTTGDGLTWRGSLSDTASIQPINNQNAWVILDTVNLKIYSFDFTSNTWNALSQDTTSLSNRINLKLNISDTAAMLLPYLRDADTTLLNLTSRFATKLNLSDTAAMLANYATKAYADTTGRLYARQDYTTGVTTSTLTWTQSDTLIPGGVTFVQVYRNGQILLPSQYTIPTSTSVVIAASSFKVGENYTVIFPRGGGAGSGSGSGSLTSISGGTGILVSPDPITTTGTVSADLSVLMELTDTSLLNLTSRFNTKQNTLVSGTNIKTVNSNSLLGSGNISVGTLVAADTVSLSNRINTKLNTTDTASLSNRINLKLNSADTASLSNRINAKGTGTVTSVATGYGLSGGTITSTGTLLLDSAVVFSRIRDSIVDVAIGNDTIKILKQEYAPATTSVLTWTITPKFPIQLKAYILVFRNGQLLINDQYNLTDTNKITIVSSSFKVGANYTVVTVSGIGSVGTGVFPNPVYPEAGIAVSTGSAWASSIANNSSNWNIAFNDKITNAAFSGTNTKTLTLTQYDGGTFAPTFDDLQGVTGVTAGTGLTGGTITSTGTVAVDFGVVAPLASPTFTGTVGGITKTMVGLGNVDNTTDAGKPVSTATQTALNGKENTITAGTTGQYYRGDKTFQTLDKSAVGLSNVDNTTDANKPISTLTQTALNLKLNTDDTSLLNLTSRFAAKQNTLSGTGFVKASGTTISYDNSSYLTTGVAASTYQTILSNPVTGTGTNNYIPKFTSTGSTIGNSTLIDNGSTISTSSILSTTNYAALDAGNNTHRLTNTLSGNQTWTPSAGFLTSYFNNNVSGGWYYNTLLDNSGFPILSILSTSNDRKKSGITLNSQGTANGTYSPAITFSSLSNSSAYYSAYAAIIGKKTGTGGTNGSDANWNTGHIEFYGTTQATDVNGGVMLNSPSMTLGLGVGIGYDAPPTIKGRLIVSEKIGINQSTPTFALDVNGTANITGATTLGSTLAVTSNITEAGNNVLTNLDTASLSSRIDAINSGGNQIANNNNSTQTISNLSGLSNYYLWINNPNTVTITLPSPSANNNKMITIKNTGAGAVFSASSNVQPLANPTPPATLVNLNVILASGGGKWTTMVSNGFEWVKMAGN